MNTELCSLDNELLDGGRSSWTRSQKRMQRRRHQQDIPGGALDITPEAAGDRSFVGSGQICVWHPTAAAVTITLRGFCFGNGSRDMITENYGGPVGRGCHNIHIAVLRSCSYPDNRFAVVQIRDLRTCACPHPRFADVRMSRSAICCRPDLRFAVVHIRDLRTCACPHPRFADVRMSRSAICCRPELRFAVVQICDLRT